MSAAGEAVKKFLDGQREYEEEEIRYLALRCLEKFLDGKAQLLVTPHRSGGYSIRYREDP